MRSLTSIKSISALVLGERLPVMADPASELNDTQSGSEVSTSGEAAARTAGVVELAEQITGDG